MRSVTPSIADPYCRAVSYSTRCCLHHNMYFGTDMHGRFFFFFLGHVAVHNVGYNVLWILNTLTLFIYSHSCAPHYNGQFTIAQIAHTPCKPFTLGFVLYVAI